MGSRVMTWNSHYYISIIYLLSHLLLNIEYDKDIAILNL